jgi:hypothetical protein
MDKSIFNCVDNIIYHTFDSRYDKIRLSKNENGNYTINTSYECNDKNRIIVLDDLYCIGNFMDEIYFKIIVNLAAQNFKIDDLSEKSLNMNGGSNGFSRDAIITGYSDIAKNFHKFICMYYKLDIVLSDNLIITLDNNEIYQFIHQLKAFNNQPNLKMFRLFISKLKLKSQSQRKKSEIKCYFDLKNGRLYILGLTEAEIAKISLKATLKL